MVHLFNKLIMGNIESSPSASKNNVGAKARKGRGKISSSHPLGDRALAEVELDQIYDFVKTMKQTNVGGNLLEEFIVRQAEKEMDDSFASSSEIIPTKFIGIPTNVTIQSCRSSPLRRHRPATSPSA